MSNEPVNPATDYPPGEVPVRNILLTQQEIDELDTKLWQVNSWLIDMWRAQPDELCVLNKTVKNEARKTIREIREILGIGNRN